MLAQGEEIYNLIPQKPPMVLVDNLLEFSKEKAITGFYINGDHILVRDGRLSESGLIENIAQSAALMTGWHARTNDSKDQDAPIGVIGGVKNLKINFLPEINSELKTEIIVLHKVLNASMISGKITSNDRVCMECEMKIFLTE